MLKNVLSYEREIEDLFKVYFENGFFFSMCEDGVRECLLPYLSETYLNKDEDGDCLMATIFDLILDGSVTFHIIDHNEDTVKTIKSFEELYDFYF